MTQPSPSPSLTSGTVAGLTINVPGGGGGKTKGPPDLYGLGVWQQQKVNPGNLPFLATALASGQHLQTAEDVVKAFAQLRRPDQIGTIQNALHMGGFYSSTFTPNYGTISQKDLDAFKDAVTLAGRSGVSVSDLLTDHAAAGMKLGIQVAQQQTQTQQHVTKAITLPNTQDLEAEADAAFQKIIGKKASPEQAARFAAFYRSMAAGAQRAAAQAQYDATNPPVSDALANADPNQLIAAATTSPEQQMIAGHPPNMGVQHPGGPHGPGAELGLGAADTTQGDPPSFSDRVGGLMSLGQAVLAAQQQAGSAQAPAGLSFTTADSLPSASTAAENFARNSDPKGAAANDTANVFNTFLGLLSRNFG